MTEIEQISRLRSLVERFGDRMPDVKFLLEVIDKRDARIQGLLEANNALLDRARAAEGWVEILQAGNRFLVHAGGEYAENLRKAESRERLMSRDRDVALIEVKTAWEKAEQAQTEATVLRSENEQLRSGIEKVNKDTETIKLAENWYRSIKGLEKKRELESNTAYTAAQEALKAHLALKSHLAEN